MKKTILLLLLAAMLFGCTGCNNNSNVQQDDAKSAETITITKENFSDYFLVNWHVENLQKTGSDVWVAHKGELHIDISPRRRLDANDVTVTFEIVIDGRYGGDTTETITLRYDGEATFWIPIKDPAAMLQPLEPPKKDEVIIKITSATGTIVM